MESASYGKRYSGDNTMHREFAFASDCQRYKHECAIRGSLSKKGNAILRSSRFTGAAVSKERRDKEGKPAESTDRRERRGTDRRMSALYLPRQRTVEIFSLTLIKAAEESETETSSDRQVERERILKFHDVTTVVGI